VNSAGIAMDGATRCHGIAKSKVLTKRQFCGSRKTTTAQHIRTATIGVAKNVIVISLATSFYWLHGYHHC
jgi:hypothetical protein